MPKGYISDFIDRHYCHFNAAVLKEAAQAYKKHINEKGKMMVTLAGAMSTAEIGKSFAEMIRGDYVQIISCTGANLEEDIFNLVAHDFYKRIPDWRALSSKDELNLLKNKFNRVTDTCIPEEEAFRRVERQLIEIWKSASGNKKRFFPHELFYQLIDNKLLEKYYQINPDDSWVVAACRKKIPIVVGGWEDSTIGNVFAARCIQDGTDPTLVKSGIEYMMFLANWYRDNAKGNGIGFFQIGGGIAGDFPICVVPMMSQDLHLDDVPCWSYFCQVSDSTTSYGSYSGAVPNEKITWGKLDVNTPKFIIESDATIVVPLLFAYVLGW
ncbi:MAG: deoxyhypusine synthase family protein [Bacteroidetes bacterium]|nr:deoxyhypusine synthase family protein [Bacteroidota bacterium]